MHKPTLANHLHIWNTEGLIQAIRTHDDFEAIQLELNGDKHTLTLFLHDLRVEDLLIAIDEKLREVRKEQLAKIQQTVDHHPV